MQRRNTARSGFTLTELIIAIAILAGLAAIVLVAIQPQKRLEDARTAQVLHNAEQMTKAINMQMVDTFAIPEVPDPSVRDICKKGVVETLTADSCVNLDNLVTQGYLASIPVTHDYTNDARISGYQIERNGGYVAICPKGNCHNGGAGGNTGGGSSTSTSSSVSACQNTYALTFDGVDDHLHALDSGPLSFRFNPPDPFSLSAWVNVNNFVSTTTSTPNSTGVLSRLSKSGGYVLTIKGNPTSGYQAYCFLMDIQGAGTMNYKAVAGITFQTSTWTHLACVSDGVNWKVYTDGVAGSTAPVSGTYSTALVPETNDPPPPADVYLGRAVFSILGYMKGTYFKGSIDDPRIYAGALDQAAIDALRQNTEPAGGAYTLRGNWNFNAGTGAIATANIPELDATFEGMASTAWTCK